MQMAEHVERFDASIINDHIHTSQLSEGGPHALIGDQATYTCDALSQPAHPQSIWAWTARNLSKVAVSAPVRRATAFSTAIKWSQ